MFFFSPQNMESLKMKERWVHMATIIMLYNLYKTFRVSWVGFRLSFLRTGNFIATRDVKTWILLVGICKKFVFGRSGVIFKPIWGGSIPMQIYRNIEEIPLWKCIVWVGNIMTPVGSCWSGSQVSDFVQSTFVKCHNYMFFFGVRSCHSYLGGGNSKIFMFISIWGRWDPFWRSYFSKGLVQPPTSYQSDWYMKSVVG